MPLKSGPTLRSVGKIARNAALVERPSGAIFAQPTAAFTCRLACFLRARKASFTLPNGTTWSPLGPEAPDALDQAFDRRREHEIRHPCGRLSRARSCGSVGPAGLVRE